MKRETINTFSDGMSLDLTPLGTPNKTLTNCLNGTLITYNGNELTLQNDMGNVAVGTSYLPQGYVPVGMKEHGGIIYVASYNPETNKGQIGCFPSPQQIYVSEAAQTVIDINIQKQFLLDPTLETTFGFPVINFNEYKEEIFKDSVTQEAKIFNAGDKYIIKTNEILSPEIRQAIDDNILVLKLYLIPTSGDSPIELSACDSTNLKLYDDGQEWDKKLWIFLNIENLPFETLLNKHNEYLQVFPGPQGTLQFVIEFNTFLLFNLYREISKIGNDFGVTFIGEAEADKTDSCRQVSDTSLIPLGLYGNINYSEHNLSRILELHEIQSDYKLKALTKLWNIGAYNKLFYDIMPASSYGILKLQNNNFLKSGELTKDILLNSHNKITNWDFEINKDNAIIKWTYTTFTDDPIIDHMRFVFIPLDEVLDNGGLSKSQIDELYISSNIREESGDAPNVYSIRKSYYSGDFEDQVEIGEDALLSNYIYLCRLDVIYNDHVVNGQEYKLLYTGTFFNDKDVQLYNNDNRPQIDINCDLSIEQTYTVKSFTYTTLLENENGEIVEETKNIVTANDVMFLANDDKLLNKIVGIIINVDCEVTSTICIDDNIENLQPLYAGRFDPKQTLQNCTNNDIITCNLYSNTKYNYEGDGNEEVKNLLIEKIEKESLIDKDGNEINIDNVAIAYTKQGNTYQNTSTFRIHRGIISRFGQSDFYTVLLESLFPVYEPDDTLYNEQLFGFTVEEDGSLSNVIAGDNFMGLAMYLARRRNIDASTTTFEQYIKDEKLFGKKTALSKYDIDNLKPYSFKSTITEGNAFINPGSEGTSRIEAISKMNNRPINIIASNGYERLWDRSYYDGDVDTRITNLMCLPHSEIFEKIEGSMKLDFEDLTDDMREKYYGAKALYIRENLVEGPKDYDLQGHKNALFHTSHGITNAMYITWKTLYGNVIINIATPLTIEQDTTETELIRVNPIKNGEQIEKLEVTRELDKHNEKYKVNLTHLRADHMLFCLLSQILITKRKNADLLLNAPSISQMCSTTGFKNKIKVVIEGEHTPVVVLNERNIESLLSHILSINVLKSLDNFIPKFISSNYNNAYLEFGGKVTASTNRFGLVNINNLFYCEGLPEFSTVTNEERVNIYPGEIEKILGEYLCQLNKDKYGLYKKNEELIDSEGKFYKVFLPTVISESNNSKSKYWCKNIETYKLILEGFAYNDVLLPKTKIELLLGQEIEPLRALEDIESPYFNLLYLNSINLKFHLDYSEHCSDLTEGEYYRPADFCHGFAFITLFGDLSRFLDALVFLSNTKTGLATSAWEVDKGWAWDNCYARNIYEYEGVSSGHFGANVPEDLFRLGTSDWCNAKIERSDDVKAGDSDDIDMIPLTDERDLDKNE